MISTRLTFFWFSVLVCFCFFGIDSTSGHTFSNRDDDDKIPVELYYESQCPGCRAVLTTSFYEAFSAEGFLEMADVKLIPYGNAHETGPSGDGTYEFECQHGPSECMYNTIEACALDKIEDPLVVFHFIDCIEHNDESREVDQDYEKVFTACTVLSDLEDELVEAIWSCANGKEGNLLNHEMAVQTESLSPSHDHVPWVVVDGKYNEEVADEVMKSLLDWVCFEYSGPNRSPDCPPDTKQKDGKSLLRAGLSQIGVGVDAVLNASSRCWK